MDRIVFKEYKKTYFGRLLIFDCILAKKTADELVIIYEIQRPMSFLDRNLSSGSRSYGYFWPSRNYNVYHWIGPGGETLFFYVNVSKDTTILGDRVEWKDLIVDVTILPDGTTKVLDEDEVPEAMPQEDKRIIESTKRLFLHDAQKLTREIGVKTMKLRKQHRIF